MLLIPSFLDNLICARYLGLHSPTDVVAGASLSVIVVTLGLVFGASLDYHLTAYKPSSLSVIVSLEPEPG